MDIAPPNQHPATSDDELAKVLAGIGANDSADHPPAAAPHGNQSAGEAAGLQFEETPGPLPPAGSTNVNDLAPAQSGPLPDAAGPVAAPTPVPAPQPAPPVPAPEPTTPTMSTLPPAVPVGVGGLDDLKKTALEELRPLVGKLNLSPEEKFDTLLLIIRSTDDQSLLEPAHEAARAITDENKRAQALLDVIKEIDYFSQGQQPPVLQ
jgi:hypothetical protein